MSLAMGQTLHGTVFFKVIFKILRALIGSIENINFPEDKSVSFKID
jgi:hypothetical protein